MLPCGTPSVMVCGSDNSPFIKTLCCLLARYDLDHLKDLSDSPKCSSLHSSTLWFRESNALEISINSRPVTLPSSIDSRTQDQQVLRISSAVVVHFLFSELWVVSTYWLSLSVKLVERWYILYHDNSDLSLWRFSCLNVKFNLLGLSHGVFLDDNVVVLLIKVILLYINGAFFLHGIYHWSCFVRKEADLVSHVSWWCLQLKCSMGLLYWCNFVYIANKLFI